MTQTVCTPAATRTLSQRLSDRIGSHKYDMWFARTAKLTLDGACLNVATSSRFVADWIVSHFSNDLRAIASESLDYGSDVHIHV